MTVSELDLGAKTAAEAVEALHENADKLNGEESKDDTELLVEKLASLADAGGVNVSAVKVESDTRFSDEERKLFSPAIQERAERLHAQKISATLEKTSEKYKSDPCPVLPKREDGYWLDTSFVTPDVPEQGPYANRKEADEARQVNIKMYKREQKEKAATNGNRKTTKQKAAEINHPSHEDITPTESEHDVSKKTKASKKKKSAPNGKKTSPVSKSASPKAGSKAKAPAKPKAEKKAKAPKVAKEKQPRVKKVKVAREDGTLSCVEAAAKVLKDAGKPLSVPEMFELMKAKKLWKPGAGKTPTATINAKIVLEIKARGKDSRFKRTDHGIYTSNG